MIAGEPPVSCPPGWGGSRLGARHLAGRHLEQRQIVESDAPRKHRPHDVQLRAREGRPARGIRETRIPSKVVSRIPLEEVWGWGRRAIAAGVRNSHPDIAAREYPGPAAAYPRSTYESAGAGTAAVKQGWRVGEAEMPCGRRRQYLPGMASSSRLACATRSRYAGSQTNGVQVN